MQGGQAELVRELRAHGVAQTVAFSPDGIHVATASYNSSAKLWTLATGSLVKTLISHSKEVRGVGFSKEGKLLITASDDKSGTHASFKCIRTCVVFCVVPRFMSICEPNACVDA